MNEWISVKDRLPCGVQTCVVAYWNSTQKNYNYELGVYSTSSFLCQSGFRAINEVAYWMPLTDAPEEEQ